MTHGGGGGVRTVGRHAEEEPCWLRGGLSRIDWRVTGWADGLFRFGKAGLLPAGCDRFYAY